MNTCVTWFGEKDWYKFFSIYQSQRDEGLCLSFEYSWILPFSSGDKRNARLPRVCQPVFIKWQLTLLTRWLVYQITDNVFGPFVLWNILSVTSQRWIRSPRLWSIALAVTGRHGRWTGAMGKKAAWCFSKWWEVATECLALLVNKDSKRHRWWHRGRQVLQKGPEGEQGQGTTRGWCQRGTKEEWRNRGLMGSCQTQPCDHGRDLDLIFSSNGTVRSLGKVQGIK